MHFLFDLETPLLGLYTKDIPHQIENIYVKNYALRHYL